MFHFRIVIDMNVYFQPYYVSRASVIDRKWNSVSILSKFIQREVEGFFYYELVWSIEEKALE